MKLTNHIDGWLYVGIGLCTALTNSFTTEAAAKFVDPVTLFYFNAYLSALNAALLAAKMYRSTAYGDVKAQQRIETQFITKPPTN